MLVLKTAEYFCGGLTETEKRQLFDEHVQWYRMYGMSMRPVPQTWEEFQTYWDRVCRDELVINRATLDIFQIRIPKPKFVPLPSPVWDQMFRPLVARQRWIAAGLFDPVVREKAGMRWTAGDELLLRLFGKAVEVAFWVVPEEIRLHPRALTAYKRQRARCVRRGRSWKHRRSWRHRATGAGCRCTISRDARRWPSARGLWCIRRSRSPGCGLLAGAGGRPEALSFHRPSERPHAPISRCACAL
jgi:hypothetical protein